MSISKCPKCSKSMFQIESINPLGSNREILSVICHGCNSVVGTLDYIALGEEQKETNLKIKIIDNKLDTINNNIGQLMNGVKLLYNKLEDLKGS